MHLTHRSLHFQMYDDAWEMIRQEVMDWRDPGWTSMTLPGGKTSKIHCSLFILSDEQTLMCAGFTVCLPLWDAQVVKPIGPDDPRRPILVQMVAVQLLASCFTPHRYPKRSRDALGGHRWNSTKRAELGKLSVETDGDSDEVQISYCNSLENLVSSLGQHALRRSSPALGHHARHNSAIDLWPNESGFTASREARLAERVSYSRRLRGIGSKESEFYRRNDTRSVHPICPVAHTNCRSTCQRPRHQSSRSDYLAFLQHHAPRLRYLDRFVIPNTGGVPHSIKVLNVKRRSDHKDSVVTKRPWYLAPRLSPEYHPVFVQPVKQYVIKRLRYLRRKRRHDVSLSKGVELAGMRHSNSTV